jgi:hypothetical protein
MSATMVRIRIPSDAVSSAGRAAHDAGLAALLGGNLYGRIALHPALAGVGEKSERGKVVNRARRRYGWIDSASLLAIAAGWAGARVNQARPSSVSPRERTLAKGRDAAVAAVALTGAATALTGMRFARSAPDGAVPLEGWEHAGGRDTLRGSAPQATPECAEYRQSRRRAGARRRERRARAGELRRPPTRRLLRSRY